MSDCIFCRIISGEIPSNKIIETDDVLVIPDAFPMAEGHLLVISKRHTANMHELDDRELSVVVSTAREVITRMKDRLGTGDYNFVINNGPASGQVILHVHCHIVPRTEGDGIIRYAGGNKKDDDYYTKLADKLK